MLARVYDLGKGAPAVIDIGTGAGFPGIPLKIFFRNIKLTLVESQKKKALFLAVLLSRIGLNDVNVFGSRGESLAKDEAFREKFDVALMREFGRVPLNLEIGAPFVKMGGILALWKGEADLKQIEKSKEFANELGVEFGEPLSYKLNDNITRYIIIAKKVWNTPSKYPRSYAVISRNARKNAS